MSSPLTSPLAAPSPWPRPFGLRRLYDVTGNSDTGLVATGVVWPDGRATMRWQSAAPPPGYHRRVCQVATYECAEDMMAVHGHGGSTVLDLADPLQVPVAWELRLFTLVWVLGDMLEQEIWWWGTQWGAATAGEPNGGPAATARQPSVGRPRRSPQVTLWPDGSVEAWRDFEDSMGNPFDLLWLPDDADRLAAIAPPTSSVALPGAASERRSDVTGGGMDA